VGQRTGVAAASNAVVVPVVTYGADPIGLRMFASLARRYQRGVSGQEGRIYHGASDDPSISFNGYTTSPQRMTGVAPLGTPRAVVDRQSELADARPGTPLDNAAMRVFAQRLERRK